MTDARFCSDGCGFVLATYNKTGVCAKCQTGGPTAARKKRESREADPEHERSLQRAWYATNRKQVREKGRAKYAEDREGGARRQREYNRAHPEKKMIVAAKQRAAAVGVPFDITEEDIVIPDVCPILEIPMFHGEGLAHAGSPSLDRITPRNGYVRGNIQVISRKANTCKNDLTDDELVVFCTNILKTKGFEVTQIVERISCPRCYSEGPHERVACAVDGSTRSALCIRCNLEWKIAG